MRKTTHIDWNKEANKKWKQIKKTDDKKPKHRQLCMYVLRRTVRTANKPKRIEDKYQSLKDKGNQNMESGTYNCLGIWLLTIWWGTHCVRFRLSWYTDGRQGWFRWKLRPRLAICHYNTTQPMQSATAIVEVQRWAFITSFVHTWCARNTS